MLSPASEPSQFAEPSARLISDGLINAGGYIGTLVIGFLLVPVMLRGLGAELYGIWVMAICIAGWGAVLCDGGVSWSVICEVASRKRGDRRDEVTRFIAAARKLYAVMAVAGSIAIACLGASLSGTMGLAAPERSIASTVFIIVAAAFIPGQMFAYEMVLLQGLRRFDLANLLTVTYAFATAAGTVAAIRFGLGLLGVVSAQAVLSVAFAALAYLATVHVEPIFRWRFERSDWQGVWRRIGFSGGSQLVSVLNTVCWESAPILIGPILGSPRVAQYHVGRKMPQMAARLFWTSAQAVIPAAAGNADQRRITHARQVMETGTRWLLMCALPACIVLLVLAPEILFAWVGSTDRESIMVFRLITTAAMLQALCTPPFNVLWGCGEIRSLLGIMAPVTFATVLLTALLVGRIGVVGAACALLFSTVFLTMFTVRSAARMCDFSVAGFARIVAAGLIIPVFACTALIFALRQFVQPIHWPGLAIVSATSVAGYCVVLYLYGASEEDRLLLKRVMSRFGAPVRAYVQAGSS